MHASGIPTLFFQASDATMVTDSESSSVIINALSSLFGLPIAAAKDAGTEKIAFVVIDVPAAKTPFETIGQGVLENAGLEYEVIYVPAGTADMTPQMQQVTASGAGLVHVLGNDSFCIAAFQGLSAVGFEGEVTSVTQCATPNAIEASPPDIIDGMSLTSSVAAGAVDDPGYQLYEAIMDTYGDVDDIDNPLTMSAYSVVSGLATSLEGISGDITPASVIETMRAMPESELPGGGGVTFQCGGSAFAIMPAVCPNQFLRATLDADGAIASYEVVDASELVTL